VKLAAAVLCDYAGVRDGLLTVVGAGVTRIWRQDLPAPMNVMLALMIELHRIELDKQHSLEVLVQDQDGEAAAQIQGGFSVPPPNDLQAGELQLVPMPIDLRNVALRKHGNYSIEVSVNGSHQATMQFRLMSRPPDAKNVKPS
jgi:hypothetical protein